MNGEKIFGKYVTDAGTVSHTERVVGMCEYFANRMGLPEGDRELLINSAWLHDIAKSQYGESHNLPENVAKVLNGVELQDDILDVIFNHKNGFNPKKELTLVCSILRICDKLDKFNKKASDASHKCNSSMLLIEKQLTPEEFEQFKAVYDEIYFTKLE